MTFRIEQDETKKREPFAGYTYRIYDDNRLVARYWHDHRGDEHEIEFLGRKVTDWPFFRMIDFIEGGGSEPLRLTDKAVLYLQTTIGPK